jgi:hypothetical protein
MLECAEKFEQLTQEIDDLKSEHAETKRRLEALEARQEDDEIENEIEEELINESIPAPKKRKSRKTKN